MRGGKLFWRYLAAIAITLFFLFPIYWLFIISFKTPDEIFSYPPKWYPSQIHFGNYTVLFKDGDAITVWNSLVVAALCARTASRATAPAAKISPIGSSRSAWCRRSPSCFRCS
jgi:ABC-type glycerol-3-phosphate transport system permease component